MNFDQMILQEGFGAVSFDLWILLVKYEIPSIFISSKVIPETRFKRTEFVCYLDDKHEDNFAFIVIPAMYKRKKQKNPEYTLIINDQQQVNISLQSLNESECLHHIKEAINIVYPIGKYIDDIFEKRPTTKHPARKADAVNIEFMEVSQSALLGEPEPETKPDVINLLDILEEEEEKPKKVIKLKKGRKLKPTIILEEEVDEEKEGENLVVPIEEAEEDTSAFEIELPPSDQKIKQKKTKKKHANVKVNPPGKTKTKKNFSV